MSGLQVDQHIHEGMRLVAKALKQDADSKLQDAYKCYLISIQFIVQTLLQDVEDSAKTAQELKTVTPNTKNFIRLGQQCMERLGTLITGESKPDAKDESQVKHEIKKAKPSQPPTTLSQSQPPPNLVEPAGRKRAASQLSHMELAYQDNQKLMAAYQSRMARIQNPNNVSLNLTLQRKMAENVAIAKAREQALMKKMQARQRRLQEQAARRFSSTVGMTQEEQERRHMYMKILDYEQKTKWPFFWRHRLSLHPSHTQFIQDLIRKIISVEDHPITEIMLTYQKKLITRIEPLVQKHIKELEELKVPFTKPRRKKHLSQEVKSQDAGASAQTDTPDKTSESDKMTERNEDFRKSFEQAKDDVAQAIEAGEETQEILKADIKGAASFPMPDMSYLDDLDDLYGADTEFEILESPSCLGPGDEASVEEGVDSEQLSEMTEEALRRHVRITTKDVKDYLEKIQAMFIIAYEQLDTHEGRDMCYSCLEEPFFKPLWHLLVILFRLANKEKEEDLAVSMTQNLSCIPQHLNIPGPLCLEADFPTPYSFPYELAVKELQRVTTLVCPLAKLQCIVQVSKLICHCIDEHYRESGKTESAPAVGADDLLPIFSYVLIKSAKPQIVSECHAMEEFIHEGYLMGEEGYCLTSLQTCLGYVIRLSKDKD